MPIKDPHEDLERRVIKGMDSIICEFDACILRGSYYKCYFSTYQKCILYLDWIITTNNRDKKKPSNY